MSKQAISSAAVPNTARSSEYFKCSEKAQQAARLPVMRGNTGIIERHSQNERRHIALKTQKQTYEQNESYFVAELAILTILRCRLC